MKSALILGASGQDGSYLSKLLLARGYKVAGTSRDAQLNPFLGLKTLGVYDQVEKRSLSLGDFRGVLDCIQQVKPDEVYNLSGQSSVGLSFEQPRETFDSIFTGTLNLLEAIRFLKTPIRLYNSCSSECFGSAREPSTENTPFNPKSPYGVAKAAAHWAVVNYRESFGIYACSGILFNHESPLRPERFVTQKIIKAAVRISKGSKEKLIVGNINIKRDWGWAPEFVEGIYRMLQADLPDDYILATGTTWSLKDFIEKTFSKLNMNWQDHVVTSQEFARPSDIDESYGNANKAYKKLGWKTEFTIDQIIDRMIVGEA